MSYSNEPDSKSALTLSLREHNIGFVLPDGATLESAKLSLPHGAIISGVFIGDLVCERGSAILTRNAKFCGNIEADRVYIEGEVDSLRTKRSQVIGRMLIAASRHATIRANLISTAHALHHPKFWGEIISLEHHLQDIEAARSVGAGTRNQQIPRAA